MTRELNVFGPYEIPYETNDRSAKYVSADDGRQFFDDNPDLATGRGCYLFAIRTRGLRAVYVGKATRDFRREVFTADKLQKLNSALHAWPRGTPVALFVVTPPRVHSPALISDVERYLIRSAKRAWPDLLNIHHVGENDWEIRGVTAAHKGTPSEAAQALTRLLKLE
ncbi:MAG: hypothetical protein IT385_20045 [Deltaproteobacteria bacterium]|nr:hypothetical protein [Deltaproteobacteria bacterium]